MKWLELHIDTTHAGLDTVVAMLSALDIDGVVIDDEAEFQDFLENNQQYWDYVDEDLEKSMQGKSRITFYLLDSETGYSQLAQVRIALQKLKEERDDCGSLLLTMENIQDADWETNWKKYYHPLEIGERLLVVPQWELDDPKVKASTRVPLVLDPGLTFGTGSHATTQLCLTALEKEVKAGDRVLDLGCGSGILSIAALRLGAKTAVGVDIDPKAEDIARQNAAYNGFESSAFTALTGNVTEDTKLMDKLTANTYDIVLVNIVADVIIALSPVLPQVLSEGSTLILSGILDTRLADVLEALKKAGLSVTAIREKEEWRCVCAERSHP